MKMKIVVISFLIQLIPITIFAGANVNNAKVTGVGMYGTGHIYIHLDTEIPEPGCAQSRFDIAFSNDDADQSKMLLSIALTALATGNRVIVNTNGCFAGRPTVDKTGASWFVVMNNPPN